MRIQVPIRGLGGKFWRFSAKLRFLGPQFLRIELFFAVGVIGVFSI